MNAKFEVLRLGRTLVAMKNVVAMFPSLPVFVAVEGGAKLSVKCSTRLRFPSDGERGRERVGGDLREGGRLAAGGQSTVRETERIE